MGKIRKFETANMNVTNMSRRKGEVMKQRGKIRDSLLLFSLFLFVVFLAGNGTIPSPAMALDPILYVAWDASAGGNGTSWGQAKQTIQEAVNAAAPGIEIWVKQGTYTLPAGSSSSTSEILVNKVVQIYGGFNGTENLRAQRDWKNNTTTVSGNGNNYVRGFHITADATIDGFTITGGHLLSDSNIPTGAGILIEANNAVIQNCIVTDNQSSITGGGITLKNPTNSSSIINTWVSHNGSQYGVGGIVIESGSPKIVNCIITQNTGENGGGINCLLTSSPAITNCTIYGNTREPSGGSGVDCVGAAMVTNSIIWGNTPVGYPQITIGTGSTISYCDIDQAGYESGNYNIRLDPQFAYAAIGNFQLRTGSPCINAGSNSAPQIVTPDLGGKLRIVDGTVDMGAYEYPLVDLGLGMIYSPDLHLTWLQDANYARTSGYDADGAMTWVDAMTWATNLNYNGVGGWRLPTYDPVNWKQCSNSKLNEMEWIRCNACGGHIDQNCPFINLGGPDPPYDTYWSGTEDVLDPTNKAWYWMYG